MASFAPHEHDHEHGGGAIPHTHLTSVGIDIGSSTSHLMFSELTVGYPSPHQRRPEVLSRRIINRSRILLTPFSADWNIDADPLRELILGTFDEFERLFQLRSHPRHVGAERAFVEFLMCVGRQQPR